MAEVWPPRSLSEPMGLCSVPASLQVASHLCTRILNKRLLKATVTTPSSLRSQILRQATSGQVRCHARSEIASLNVGSHVNGHCAHIKRTRSHKFDRLEKWATQTKRRCHLVRMPA